MSLVSVMHARLRLQGIHNVAGESNKELYKDEAYFDAHLTQLG